MITADVGHDSHLRIGHVRCVAATQHAHLDHHHLNRSIGERPVCGSDQRLESRWRCLQRPRRQLNGLQRLGQHLGLKRLVIQHHPLEDRAKIGGRGGADRQARCHQQTGEQRGHRALAVGAGHQDHRRCVLRIAQKPAQLAHRLQFVIGDVRPGNRSTPRPETTLGNAWRRRLVVDESVQPAEGIAG